LNSSASEKFIVLCKENPSQEWDKDSVAALCPDDSKTADFLVEVAQCIKTPGVLEIDLNHPVEAALKSMLDADEQLKRLASLGGLANLLGLGSGDGLFSGGGGVKSGDNKTKSKYQFK
jgi:hypothetical protein